MKLNVLNPSNQFSNTYVIGEEGEPYVLIDPGFHDHSFFENYVAKHHGGECLAIILTHGHFDHWAGLVDSELAKRAPLYIGCDDVYCLSDSRASASKYLGSDDVLEVEPLPLSDGEELMFQDIKLKVIHTPFHTLGSICLYEEKEGVLFSGDTLFALGIGRTDLKGGRPRLVEKSLSKLSKLPDETVVFPGHVRKTSIGAEVAHGVLKR